MFARLVMCCLVVAQLLDPTSCSRLRPAPLSSSHHNPKLADTMHLSLLVFTLLACLFGAAVAFQDTAELDSSQDAFTPLSVDHEAAGEEDFQPSQWHAPLLRLPPAAFHLVLLCCFFSVLAFQWRAGVEAVTT